MATKSYDLLLKFLLIGDSGVGKSCILFKYAENTFQASFISTIGIDFKIKTIDFEGKKIKLQIWDTAGQERFHTIVSTYYRGAMGIMLVYDVTNSVTFNNVGRWLENIERYASDSVVRVLVGNKSDLADRRQVSAEEATRLASARGMPFYEVSARSGDGVEAAFLALVEAVMHRLPAGGGGGGGSSHSAADERRRLGGQEGGDAGGRSGVWKGSKCCT